MADEEVAVLVVAYGSGLRLLVLLVMHLALCPGDCRQVHFSSAVELHLEICTLFLRPLCIFSIFCSRNFALVDFLGPSSTHRCECSRAGGAGVAGSLLPGDSAPGSCQLVPMVLWTYTLS